MKLRPLDEMSIERSVSIGMIDHQVVRSGAMGSLVDPHYLAIPKGHDLRPAGRGEVDAEVQALTGPIERATLAVSEGRVAVGLGEQPRIRPGEGSEGQPKRRIRLLRLRWPVRCRKDQDGGRTQDCSPEMRPCDVHPSPIGRKATRPVLPEGKRASKISGA
jgi:hypothetical protein